MRAVSACAVLFLAVGCATGAVPARDGSRDLATAIDRWDEAPSSGSATRVFERVEARPAELTRSARSSAPAHARRRVDARFAGADVVNALRLLAGEARVPLVVGEGITGTVSLTLEDVDPYDALVAIAEAHGARVEPVAGILVVRPERAP